MKKLESMKEASLACKFLIFLTILISCLLGSTTAESVNLLENAFFEEWNSLPSYWEWQGAAANINQTDMDPLVGSYNVDLTPIGTHRRFDQEINGIVDVTYYGAIWVKGIDGVRVRIGIRTGQNNWNYGDYEELVNDVWTRVDYSVSSGADPTYDRFIISVLESTGGDRPPVTVGAAWMGISPPPADWIPAGEIWTIEDIDNIRFNSWRDYVLMRDLDFEYAGSYEDPNNLPGFITGAGWDPIGTSSIPFTGTFDGRGYTIFGLFINRPGGDYVGLFGRVDGGKVENVGLENMDVIGRDIVGGLVGENEGTVSNSYSTGSVSGNSSYVGGLVGENRGTVSNSFSTGDVSGNWYLGGLVGENRGTVSNSYSTGDVMRTSGAGTGFGGFVGQIANGTIEYSYSTGSVYYANADDPTGKGFVGEELGTHTYTSNFFDSEASNQDTDTIGAAEPKTTAEMKDIETFTDAGWDIDLTTEADPTDGYPFLSWQLGSSPVWYIHEKPDPDPDPDPRPRPRPRPEPEPEPPLPPVNFRGIPGEQAFDVSIELSWNESPSPGVVQYNLYASTGIGVSSIEAAGDETQELQFWLLEKFPPDVFEYTHSGLTRNAKYYYVITSLDEEGLESVVTPEVLWFVAGTGEYGALDAIDWGPHRIIDEPEIDDDNGFCFIATAAYGSYTSAEVSVMRSFRDRFLLINRFGTKFTNIYYSLSPAFADIVAENRALRSLVRVHLVPFVMAAEFVVNMN